MMQLAGGGADLSQPEAAAVTADLRKTATPVFGGYFVDLK